MISEQSRTLVGFNNRKNTVKSSTHELEDRVLESNQGEDQEKKKKKKSPGVYCIIPSSAIQKLKEIQRIKMLNEQQKVHTGGHQELASVIV